MLKILQVETDEHKTYVQELFCEYFNWSHFMFQHQFNVSYDVNALLEQDMAKLQQFTPPKGRLLLGEYENRIAGCACLRKIGEHVGEIKRMYVKPEFRRKGIGKSLLQAIIHEAHEIGYARIRLDTAPFAKEAQVLYRSLGFQEIEPYAESEIPEKYRSSWVFMELVLKPN